MTTIPDVIDPFMENMISAAMRLGSVDVVANFRGTPGMGVSRISAKFTSLPVERKISLWRDFLALFRLVALFYRERFDLVHSIMPKAGLLTMLAGWLMGVPHRIHTFTGQVWVTKRGLRRMMLKFFDKMIVRFATRILVDSCSQRDFLVAEGVLTADKSAVIGYGSICGVDPLRFRPDHKALVEVRRELDMPENAQILLFVGRLNRDKGVLDLANAFSRLAVQHSELFLLLVGAEEDVEFSDVQTHCGDSRGRVRYVSFTATPERYMAAATVFCLPSYREGFGQVIIEAASSGVPAVCSRIYGITDAVVDEQTGLLFPPGDTDSLVLALQKLLSHAELRQEMGKKARERAHHLFSSTDNAQQMLAYYSTLLTARP